MVCVETWSSAADLQREILALADTAGFGSAWHRSLGAWGGLKRTERLVVLGDQDAAVGWILARIVELDTAGVLGLVKGGQVAT